jgi:hypothetical protein
MIVAVLDRAGFVIVAILLDRGGIVVAALRDGSGIVGAARLTDEAAVAIVAGDLIVDFAEIARRALLNRNVAVRVGRGLRGGGAGGQRGSRNTDQKLSTDHADTPWKLFDSAYGTASGGNLAFFAKSLVRNQLFSHRSFTYGT